MPHPPAAPGAELNAFERINKWLDYKLEDHPVIATITTLALTVIICTGAMSLVTASGFNPYAIGAAAVIITATIAYSSWILAKICLLNDNDERTARVLRGDRWK